MSSLPEQSCRSIKHPYEREAVALLYQAGWTYAELAMTFNVTESSIGRLLAAEGVTDT